MFARLVESALDVEIEDIYQACGGGNTPADGGKCARGFSPIWPGTCRGGSFPFVPP
ncbi:MAG: hypothetical protein HXS44_12890 [Theionarchaea archaeon]|nr:hypothetical protein [Theionarchaea archaeon]